MTYTVLGLSAGSPGGNAEILLREAMAALRAKLGPGPATDNVADSTELRLVRLAELQIASGLDPDEPDDIWWFWEQLLDADAVIISAPILTRTMPGRLKLLVDRLLGPNADAAIVAEILRLRAAGEEPAFAFRADERVLKARVAGLIAVGGALTPQWKSLALPTMHTLTLSMQIAVVDQLLVGGTGTPKSVVLDEDALAAAARLGRHVAAEIGRPFDEAAYHGPPGLCPLCHLNVIELEGPAVTCATCGARGRLGDHGDVAWFDLDSSVISMAEKHAHFEEILATARRHADQRELITERAQPYQSQQWVLAPETDRVRPAGPWHPAPTDEQASPEGVRQ